MSNMDVVTEGQSYDAVQSHKIFFIHSLSGENNYFPQ